MILLHKDVGLNNIYKAHLDLCGGGEKSVFKMYML